MMATQQQPQFDWASEALTSLSHANMAYPQRKPDGPFAPASATQANAFSIPPALLTNAAIERYGQVTPPEELSPAHPPRDDRESSIPVEVLRNETINWAKSASSQAYPQDEPSPKRRRTSKPSMANQDSAYTALPVNPMPVSQDMPQDMAYAHPDPPKRKRGRPKSQPQMVEAYTADGFPFQVSSARQTHLEKNRVAAHKCRQRKKEYINGLEGRAREFSNKNKMLKENVALLREEVLTLKNEVLRHAGCGFWAVDEYLARCAGDLLGMEAPRQGDSGPSSHQHRHTESPAMSTSRLQRAREASTAMSMTSTESHEFGGLELLKDFTDEDMDELVA